MPVQDDVRELQLIELFDLYLAPGRGRSDVDALLVLDDKQIPFELKSTTKSSVTTVRDFGPEHVRKWRTLHWLFGFYDASGAILQTCYYASPVQMEPWITKRELYVRTDFILADVVPPYVDQEVVAAILGIKETYTLADARLIQKNQYSSQTYRDKMDLAEGYSLIRMLEIVRDRCEYVLKRGATLNNPHIPAGYFAGFAPITVDHAVTLRQLVRLYLQQSASATDDATA